MNQLARPGELTDPARGSTERAGELSYASVNSRLA